MKGSVRMELGFWIMCLAQTAEVWHKDMEVTEGCITGPAKENRALKRICNRLSTYSLNTELSSKKNGYCLAKTRNGWVIFVGDPPQ